MILTGLGGGTPGGATTQIQFNNAGVFGGSVNLTWASDTLTIGSASAVGVLRIFDPQGTYLEVLPIDTDDGFTVTTFSWDSMSAQFQYPPLFCERRFVAEAAEWVASEDYPGADMTGFRNGIATGQGVGKATTWIVANDDHGAIGTFNNFDFGIFTNNAFPSQWWFRKTTAFEKADGTFTVSAAGAVAASGLTVGGHLVTLTGALTRVGAHALTLTTIGATNVTLPTTGTLATLDGAEAFTNKTGNISQWTNDSSYTTLLAVNAQTLAVFAATTSLQLKTLISDETGSGSLVFGTGPTLTGPVTLTEVVGSSGLTITGATQTASFPALNLTQTLNNSGVAFTVLKVNATNTASNSSSLLFDFQVDGATVLSFDRSLRMRWGSAPGGPMLRANSAALQAVAVNQATGSIYFAASRFSSEAAGYYGWAADTDSAGTNDTRLYREAPAVIQMGADVNGAAVAQTFKAHDGITGTNIAGGNLTLAGGRGTGTGAPGNLIFQTAVQVASGTTAQTLATRFQIIENKIALFGVTPVVQPATGGAASTFAANTSLIANDTATFDGYTIGQVVKALRNLGALA